MFSKATTLTEVSNAFQPRPLDATELATYYVQVDQERDAHLSRLVELKKALEKQNIKILFAGHRGSGKSTELNRLRSEIQERFFVVPFSVSDELDIGDMDYIDLVMVMMEKLAEAAVSEGLISQDDQLLEKITGWLTDVTDIKAEQTAYQAEVQAGLKASQGLLGVLLGVVAEFKASVRAGTDQKREYRKKIEPRISLLKANCNILINTVDKVLLSKGKELLLLVEDLDKVEPQRIQDIFSKRSGVLSEINTRIIYTVSLFSLSSPSLRDMMSRFQIQSLPMIKVCSKEGTEHASGIAAIWQIVERRMDTALFANELVLAAMIKNSGGVLRDLFEMVEVAANAADYGRSTVITAEHADYALQRLKSKYHDMISVGNEKAAGLTTEKLYEKLVEIAGSSVKKFPLDEILLMLLSCLAVVEYNGEQWFDVHPAVKSLLKDMGKV
jgi:hypothetical protein